MATFMDLALFQHFGSIFVFLIVFAVVYGFLLVTNIMKDKSGAKGLYAIISLSFAFLAMMSKSMVKVISIMTPAFTVFIIFIFLALFVVRMFAGDDDVLFGKMIRKSSVYWVLIVVFIIILISSFSSVFGQRLLEQQVNPGQEVVVATNGSTASLDPTSVPSDGVTTAATGSYSNNVLMTLIHPKVLGLILLLLIGVFTILFLAKTPDPTV